VSIEPETVAQVPPPAPAAAPVPADRPELAIGGAFAGGFLIAQILKRLG
jgi:hypothetical protein